MKIQKMIILLVVLFFSSFFYSVSDANHDVLNCVGNQGYVNGTECNQGSSVWGPCDSSRCFSGSTECVLSGGSCGHWVGCPSCPTTPPCSPSWGNFGDCSVECGGGIQYKYDGCGHRRSRQCNEEVCLGECGTLNGGVYNYKDTEWHSGTFCIPDSVDEPDRYAVSDPDPVPFPTFDTESDGCSVEKPCADSVSWSCKTATGGTENGACSATVRSPSVECGSAKDVETNTKPIDLGLCSASKGDADAVPSVKLTNGGNWVWGCQHSVFSEIKTAVDACKAPSCISSGAVSAKSPIMLSENDMYSTVSVSCPDLCCTVTNMSNNNVSVEVCDGDSKQIEIVPGQNKLSSICRVPNTPPVEGPPITVRTMCIARECNAQGTCQSTPQFGEVLTDCTSTCNSNADCSSGRMIETRP